MKKIIITSTLLSVFVFVSCKKTRTCSCDITGTTTTTTVPRNGAATTVNTSTSTDKNEATYAKLKKSEMKRLVGCIDNTNTSTSTYTLSVFSGTAFVTADVTKQQVDISTCKIK